MKLDAHFWDEKYRSHQTGWDLNAPSTPLKTYIDQLENKHLRILIPGCGNAYEAEYLLEQGFTNIHLVDLSAVLVKALQNKFKNRKEIQISHQDYFTLKGPYDLLLEQTFFCAIAPDLRQAYANKAAEILAKNGRIAGLLFNRKFNQNTPPFGGHKEEYTNYFTDLFQLKTFDTCYNSIPPRAGTELFIEFVKK